MPNYGLQISADFQPFTLNELLPMVMGATQSLRDVEDAYAKQQTEADQLGYIADILEKEGSDESRMMAQKYRDYQAQIEAGRNELMETGKISRGRKALWESTRDYAKNILPMKTGYEQLAATMKEEAAHPEIARQHRATFSDLPSYIKDPFGVSRVDEKGMPIYGSVDLDKAYKLASDKYSAIANALQWDKGEKEWDDYTDILFKQYGFSVDDIKRYKAAWDSGEFNPKDVLSQIANDIYDSTMRSLGVDYQRDPETGQVTGSWDDFNRIHNTVFSAVYNAMGKGTNELVSRWEDQQNYKASQKDEKDFEFNKVDVDDLYSVYNNENLASLGIIETDNKTGKLKINKDKLVSLVKDTNELKDKYNLTEDELNTWINSDNFNELPERLKNLPLLEKRWNPDTRQFELRQVTTLGGHPVYELESNYSSNKELLQSLKIAKDYLNAGEDFSLNINDNTGLQDIIGLENIEKELNVNPLSQLQILYHQPQYSVNIDKQDREALYEEIEHGTREGKFDLVKPNKQEGYSIGYKTVGTIDYNDIKPEEIRKVKTTQDKNGKVYAIVEFKKASNKNASYIRVDDPNLVNVLTKFHNTLQQQRMDFNSITDPYKMIGAEKAYMFNQSQYNNIITDYFRQTKAEDRKIKPSMIH